MVPHEDLLVGGGLLAFGVVLVATGTLPRFARGRPGPLLALGLAILLVVAAAWRVTAHVPAGPMLLLAILGAGIVAAATFHGRSIRVGRRALAVRDIAPGVVVAVGVPLLLWLVQATFKRFSGTTPLEAFEVLFLVTPVHWILQILGIPASMDGQTLVFPGPKGLLTVHVGAACSGLQASALFLGMLALFVATERPGARRVALWTGVGLVGVYAANVLRLTVVLLAGHKWGAQALEEVHANAGWIFFVAWSLLFALWVRLDVQRPRAAAGT